MAMLSYGTGGSGGGSGSGDVVGPASSTDNAVARFDGATGKLLQDSGVTVSDVAAASVTVASVAGNALVVDVPEPAAAAGASVAGKTLTMSASDAVASTDTDGAAAGGAVTITSGAAKRRTSGNANGGNINLTPGAGIGTGTTGQVVLPQINSAAKPTLTFGDADTGLYETTDDVLWVAIAGADVLRVSAGQSALNGGNFYGNTLATSFQLSGGVASATVPNLMPSAADDNTGIGRAGADQLSLIAGGAEIARFNAGVSGVSNGVYMLRSVSIDVSSPVTVAAATSNRVFTNEGAAGAVTYNLPTAAAGYQFTFIVQSANNMVVTASSGDTIRIAGSVSSAGGTATNGTVGGVMTIVSINATEWIAISTVGTWVLA